MPRNFVRNVANVSENIREAILKDTDVRDYLKDKDLVCSGSLVSKVRRNMREVSHKSIRDKREVRAMRLPFRKKNLDAQCKAFNQIVEIVGKENIYNLLDLIECVGGVEYVHGIHHLREL